MEKTKQQLEFEELYYLAYGYATEFPTVTEELELIDVLVKAVSQNDSAVKALFQRKDTLILKKYNDCIYSDTKMDDAWYWFNLGYNSGYAESKNQWIAK